jgi:F-type H+-transporting ATPase subunit gamma
MANLQDIRRRIASVHNTRKITKAMELVSAAKLRRAQARIEALRPYAGDMIEMMMDLATYAQGASEYPLLREHAKDEAVALVVVTGDRGFAGAFNANVLRKALELDRAARRRGAAVHWLVVGKKGIGTLLFRSVKLDDTWQGKSDHPVYSDAQAIAHTVAGLYTSEQVDQVHLIYNHFKSPLEQTVMDVGLLPIKRAEVSREELRREAVTYIYEPDAETIFAGLLPAYVEIAIYRALLESSASEQGARMTAMRNASENAEEMIGSLTLSLNRARQAAITQEILEVVAGADALA